MVWAGSRKKCRECGALATDGVRISARALCDACAIARHTTAARQINARQGEFHARWIEGMRAAADKAERAHDAGNQGESVTTPAGDLAEK